MASEVYCDPCDRRDKTSIAEKFCSDCDDKLCLACLDVHMTLKSCINHHVVDVKITEDRSFSVNKNCEKHPDLTMEFYCCDHDVICCKSCMADDHRACSKLTSIELAAKDIKLSHMFEEISKQTNNLQETSSQMTDAIRKSRKLLNESKEASIEKISKLKEELHKRIDNLGSECILETNKLCSQLSEKISIDEGKVEKRVEIIQDTLTKFDFVARHGSDKQIFLLLNSIKTDIYKIDADLKELVPTLKTTTVEFDESGATAMLKSIGSVKTKQRPCDIQHKPTDQQQAQFNLRSCPALTSLHLEKKVTFTQRNGVSITGMCVTKDTRIILCNSKTAEKELIVLTSQGEFMQTIKLSSRPWDIAIEPDTTDAWVTSPDAPMLQIICTRSMSFKKHVNISWMYFGIAFVGCNIALGRHGKVDIIDKQGGCFKSLEVGTSTIHAICYTGNNKLYCCEAGRDKLHCVTLEGEIVFSYSSLVFHGPICANADHQGNVYVLCHRSNNLHKLTSDGKLLDVMLHKKDGLNSPYAASFDENCSKLFIANEHTKELLIFSCK